MTQNNPNQPSKDKFWKSDTFWNSAVIGAGVLSIGMSAYVLAATLFNRHDIGVIRDSYQNNDAAIESVIRDVNGTASDAHNLSLHAYNLSQQNMAALDGLDKQVSQAAVDAVYLSQIGNEISALKEQLAKAGPDQYKTLASGISSLERRMNAFAVVASAAGEDIRNLYGQVDALKTQLKSLQPSPTATATSTPVPSPTATPLPKPTPTPTKVPYLLPEVFTINYEKNPAARQFVSEHAAAISSVLGLKPSTLATIINGISTGEAELVSIVVDQKKNAITFYELKNGVTSSVNYTATKANVSAKDLVNYMTNNLTTPQLDAIVTK